MGAGDGTSGGAAVTWRLVFTSPSGTTHRYNLDAPNKAAAINRARNMVPKNPIYSIVSVEPVYG